MNDRDLFLLVEDDSIAVDVAGSYIVGQGIDFETANDLYTLRERLGDMSSRKPTMFAADLFFPERTGSGEVTTGYEVLEDIWDHYPREAARRMMIELIQTCTDTPITEDDPVGLFVERVAYGLPENEADFFSDQLFGDEELEEPSLFKEMRRVFDQRGYIGGRTWLEEVVENFSTVKIPDHYRAMRAALERDEANQPSGIEAIRIARGIPRVLITGERHGEGKDPFWEWLSRVSKRSGVPLITAIDKRQQDAWPMILGAIREHKRIICRVYDTYTKKRE